MRYMLIFQIVDDIVYADLCSGLKKNIENLSVLLLGGTFFFYKG